MNNRTCSIEGCDTKFFAREMCRKHYLRWKRRNPDAVQPVKNRRKPMPLADKLEAKTRKGDGCWIWEGHTWSNGYGYIHHSGKRPGAHRVAYEVANGPVPEGFVVDHKCHNPSCVKPDHLQAVTHKQNMENLSGLQGNNTSGARGVTYRSDTGKWIARASHEGSDRYGGSYSTLVEAECAAIDLRNQLHTNNLLDRVH